MRTGGWLFLDVCTEQTGLFQGVLEHLESFSFFPTASGQADPADIAQSVVRFIHPRTRDIFVSCKAALFSDISDAIRQATGRSDFQITLLDQPGREEPETQSPETEDAPGLEPVFLDFPFNPDSSEPLEGETPLPPPVPIFAPAVSMEGVARHALRRCSPHRLARIEAQDPKPPVWKNKALWPWAAILILAVGLSCHFSYMRSLTKQKQWELDLADIEYSRRLKIKDEASRTANEARSLMAELKKIEGRIKEQRRLKHILDKVIRYRQVQVPGVLTAMGNAVIDEVVISLIEEDADRKGFYMEAWALRDTGGQQFGKILNQALEPWGYKVANLQLTAGGGIMGLSGYNLKIKIVKAPKQNKPKQNKKKGGKK